MIKVLTCLVSGERPSWLVPGHFLSVSSCGPSLGCIRGGEGREPFGISSYKVNPL